jgi:GNAT superfamily N-acetyltransferase
MGIAALDIKQRETAEELWALQHSAYRTEAALIGVADLPPLRDTVQTLQACRETFWGYRSSEQDQDQDQDLIGAISFEREQEEAERYILCRLMVHPDYTRQGIGSALIKHMLNNLPANAACGVTAEIRNLPAIALYEHHGFIRKESFHPVPHITMVRMERVP